MTPARIIARVLRAYAALRSVVVGAKRHRRTMRRRKWSGRAFFIRLSRTGTQRRGKREPSIALPGLIHAAANPLILPDAAAYAHKFYPDTRLGRLGAPLYEERG